MHALRSLLASSFTKKRPARRCRLELEALEERYAPAQYDFTGAVSADSAVAANWNPNGNPGTADIVFIPNNTYCEVTQGLDVAGVFVSNSGATLKASSYVHASGWIMVGQYSSLVVSGATVESDYWIYNMGQISLLNGAATLIAPTLTNTTSASLFVGGSIATAYVTANFTNAGSVSFGGYASTLSVNGNFTQTDTGSISMGVLSGNQGGGAVSSKLAVNGDVSLDGDLLLTGDAQNPPDGGTKILPLTWTGTLGGNFAFTFWTMNGITFGQDASKVALGQYAIVP